jgi:hypothetical protein
MFVDGVPVGRVGEFENIGGLRVGANVLVSDDDASEKNETPAKFSLVLLALPSSSPRKTSRQQQEQFHSNSI